MAGYGIMGSNTDYSRVYSVGLCMNNMACDPAEFDSHQLSLVCDPSVDSKGNFEYNAGNYSHIDVDSSLAEEYKDWFTNSEPSCEFVMNKALFPLKQIFFVFCFMVSMLVAVHSQNKADRMSFWQMYSANKERFAVQLALKKALEQQEFSDDQFAMIKGILTPEGSGSDDPLFDLHIDQKYLTVGKVLGRGAQGVVLMGTYKSAKVAVKTLINVDHHELRMFRSEIVLTKSLVHPNIVKLVGITVTKELLGCILEFVSNGTLEDVLVQQLEMRINLTWTNEKYGILEGVTSGLMFLHQAKFFDDEAKTWEQCVVHRDLKPANILVTEMYVPKISDFGCSRFKQEDINMTQIGTPIYAAPEVIKGQRYDEKADIYSFAIVMVGLSHNLGNLDNLVLEEVARECKRQNMDPREGRSTANVMNFIAEGMRPPLPPDLPAPIAEIIGHCWQGKAENRPSASELMHMLTHVTRPALLHQDDGTGEKYDPVRQQKKAIEITTHQRRKSEAHLMPKLP
jgi:serine/threonine protein kinase